MKIVTVLLLGLIMLVGLMPVAATAQSYSRLVTVDATRTPLMDVLTILASKSGLNIVASPDVENREITIHLKDTTVEEALNLIVRAAGLGYERVGNSILVAEQGSLETDTGLSSYVIDLHFADAFELEPLVAKIVPQVTAVPGGNRLVLAASPSEIEQVQQIITELDVPPVQIMLETEVIEVTTDDLQEYGIDWNQLTSQTVIFAEGIGEALPGATEPDGLPESMPFGNIGFDSDNVSRQAKVLEVALDFLETNGNAKVLSRSKLATLNNRTAEIHIGDVIPYTVTGLTSTGVVDVQVEKERVGVSVKVTPRASGDGFVTATVEPNVSSIVGWKGPDQEIPWTKERRAITQVRVEGGSTFMIAGLLSEDESTEISKVPLLGDIPLIGYLFQHQRSQTKHSDLIIKITPTILR